MKKIILLIIISFLAGLILVGINHWENEGVELRVGKTIFNRGESIKVHAISQTPLFTGFPAFEVYRLADDAWESVDVYDMTCALSCSADKTDICAEAPIACAPLPEHCQDFDPLVDEFSWDRTVIKTREAECSDSDEARFCSFAEQARPGRYKVIFQYSENCFNEALFLAGENNVQKIEKEFEIK